MSDIETNPTNDSKIIDRSSGEVHMGKVPPYSVIVPGSNPGKKLSDDVDPKNYN